jgi:hypothetical protein
MRKLIFFLSLFWPHERQLRQLNSLISCSKADASWIPKPALS